MSCTVRDASSCFCSAAKIVFVASNIIIVFGVFYIVYSVRLGIFYIVFMNGYVNIFKFIFVVFLTVNFFARVGDLRYARYVLNEYFMFMSNEYVGMIVFIVDMVVFNLLDVFIVFVCVMMYSNSVGSVMFVVK